MLQPDGSIGPAMSRTTPVVPRPSIMANAMPFSPSYGVNPATLPSAVRQPAAPAPTPAAPALAQRPAGLLGGGTTDYRSLLSDANRQAREQGLFAMLMGLGRPVPRGESRLMGALQMGQQARQAAQQSALGDISTQMKLEEMERKRAQEQARLDAIQSSQDRIQGTMGQVGVMEAEAMQTAQTPGLTTFSAYQQSQMDPNQLAIAKRSEVLAQEADALAFIAPERSKQLRDQAKTLRDQATTGLMTRADAVPREESLRKEFNQNYVEETNDIVQRRNTLIELLQQGGPVSKYLTFVSAIKTVEPNSAVLSSEYESAQALSGLLTRLQVKLEGIEGTKPLPKQFREDMENVGNLMAEAAMEHYNKGAEQYRGIAIRQNLNPENVILQPTPIRNTSTMTTDTVDNPAASVRDIRTRGGVPQT
jgi:hypothetical protein